MMKRCFVVGLALAAVFAAVPAQGAQAASSSGPASSVTSSSSCEALAALALPQAKVAKARYDALRREGFEVGQALQLCVKPLEA